MNMNNRVTLQRTIFTNWNTQDQTYGYRAYDDQGQTYGNCFSLLQMNLPDDQFFRLVYSQCDEMVAAMVDSCYENALGIEIDGDDKSYEWVKETLRKFIWMESRIN